MLHTKCLHVCLHIDWSPYCTFKYDKSPLLEGIFTRELTHTHSHTTTWAHHQNYLKVLTIASLYSCVYIILVFVIYLLYPHTCKCITLVNENWVLYPLRPSDCINAYDTRAIDSVHTLSVERTTEPTILGSYLFIPPNISEKVKFLKYICIWDLHYCLLYCLSYLYI